MNIGIRFVKHWKNQIPRFKMNFLVFIVGLVAFTINTTKAQILFPSDGNTESNCVTPDRNEGSCILLEKCPNLYNLIRSPRLSQQEILFLRRSQCGYSNGKVMVCCASKDIIETSTPNVPEPNDLFPKPGICGGDATLRIHGGNETGLGEFPWMVLIEYSKSRNRKGHHCGGSLINNRYVLTAAHCIKGKGIPSDWSLTGVRLGEWDRNSERDCVVDRSGNEECADPAIDVPVEQIIVHESYDGNIKAQYNDIALLRLARSVPYTDWIKPVCLPFSTDLRSSSFDGVTMDVAGWGQTENSSTSSIKLKAMVNAFTLDKCNSVYSEYNIVLRDGQMCAGGKKGIDSCRGDSGGPLIGLDNSNKLRINYFLAGIVSFGPSPCGLEGWPGVYTRVGHYTDWIQSNVKP